VRKQRKLLSPFQKKAYEKGHRTFFVREKLVVDGTSFHCNPETEEIVDVRGAPVRSLKDMFERLKDGWQQSDADRRRLSKERNNSARSEKSASGGGG
jgi:hypothetical protein